MRSLIVLVAMIVATAAPVGLARLVHGAAVPEWCGLLQ